MPETLDGLLHELGLDVMVEDLFWSLDVGGVVLCLYA